MGKKTDKSDEKFNQFHDRSVFKNSDFEKKESPTIGDSPNFNTSISSKKKTLYERFKNLFS